MSRWLVFLAILAGAAGAARAETPQASFMADGLTLEKVAFGSELRDRELLDPGESFRIGQRVYCWNLITGGKPGELVRHVWFHEGQEIQSVELTVEFPYWRTWSFKTLDPGTAGAWRVEIRDERGTILGAQTFTCAQ